jgi:hypothetical protein
MPPRLSGRQFGLSDNPVGAFSLEELADAVRELERRRPCLTAEEISGAVFAELAMKRTRRASDLVSEAIRIARAREPRRRLPTVPTPSSALPVNAPMPSSKPGASCVNSAAASSGPGSWPRPSTSSKPARWNDEKGSQGTDMTR